MLFEMLVGATPFLANDTMKIYRNIMKNSPQYPDTMSKEAKELIEKLLVTLPAKRIGSLKKGHRDISGHAFFKPLSFDQLLKKQIPAPHVPTIDSPTDTSNFEEYEDVEEEDWSVYNKRANEAGHKYFEDFGHMI